MAKETEPGNSGGIADEIDFDIPSWAGKPPNGLHLDVMKGEKLIQKLMIDEKRAYYFGRNPKMCDFAIDHASASRVHAVLLYHKHLNRPFLVDVGSTHGTFIGKVRLEIKKPEQVQPDQSFHFGASTRSYVLREKPTHYGDGEDGLEDGGSLPAKEEELENLTEYNTALNRRMNSMVVPTDGAGGTVNDSNASSGSSSGQRKRKQNNSVTFNDEEDIINPEDIDPSIGRFRNLVSTAVIPKKRSKDAGDVLGIERIEKHRVTIPEASGKDDIVDVSGSVSYPSLSSTKLGLMLPNPAPDVDLYPTTIPPPSSRSLPLSHHSNRDRPNIQDPEEEVPLGPRKKVYAKEAWPGRKPTDEKEWDEGMNDEGDGEAEDGGGVEGDDEEEKERLRVECLEEFTKRDYITEPAVFTSLTQYFQLDGQPGPVVTHLTDNYVGLAQIFAYLEVGALFGRGRRRAALIRFGISEKSLFLAERKRPILLRLGRMPSTVNSTIGKMCNLMSGWLVDSGLESESVKGMLEGHAAQMITRHFHSKKADVIFEQSDNTGIEWLPQLIAHPPWRSLVYKLAEEFPECLMLNFAVKLISDAGFQHEISNVQTAAQQLEIFSRVVTSGVEAVLAHPPDTLLFQKGLQELIRVATHSEHTYCYTLSLLSALSALISDPQQRGSVVGLAQILKSNCEQDNSSLSNALPTETTYNPTLTQAMESMVSKKSLNPADISVLYNFYYTSASATEMNNVDRNGDGDGSSSKTPNLSTELIRDPLFLELLLTGLFGRNTSIRIQEEHKHKYVYLLAYATTFTIHNDHAIPEMRTVVEVLEELSTLCQRTSETNQELVNRLPYLFKHIRKPVVAAALLHWIKDVLSHPTYFQTHPEPVPIHLVILDEIGAVQPLMHSGIFQLLRSLLTGEIGGSDDGQLILERQKTITDRLLHLLWHGYAIPVTQLMASLYKDRIIDTSLIRYFVAETLDIVGPPYSQAFVQNFSPLVENKDIMNNEKTLQLASEFLESCQQIATT